MATRKYAWEEWFILGQFTLTKGVDYKVSQSTMYQTIRNNACQRGLKVAIRDEDNKLIIKVIGVNNSGLPHTDRATISAEYQDTLEGNVAPQAGAEESGEDLFDRYGDPITTTDSDHNTSRPQEVG